jgi:hypothetical protein
MKPIHSFNVVLHSTLVFSAALHGSSDSFASGAKRIDAADTTLERRQLGGLGNLLGGVVGLLGGTVGGLTGG